MVRLIIGNLPRQAVAPPLQAPADTVLLALDRAGRRCRVLTLALGLHLIDKVAGTTTANVVDGGLLAAQTLLLLELLVKAEHGALLVCAHVTSATATRSKVAGGRGSSKLDAGCWARCVTAVGKLRGCNASDVSCTAAARVKVRLGGGVRLCDVEVDHFDCSYCVLLW